MGIEIGDSIADSSGRAGEVVGFDVASGRAIVRPFPIPEQQDTPGRPDCFVANAEARVLKKHFERTTEADVMRERLAAMERQRAAERQARGAARQQRELDEWHRYPHC